MPDRFQTYSSGLDGPATHGFAIMPNDSTMLPEITRAIYVGSAGSVTAILQSGAQVTFANVAASSLLPIRATGIMATGTTAQQLIGLA